MNKRPEYPQEGNVFQRHDERDEDDAARVRGVGEGHAQGPAAAAPHQGSGAGHGGQPKHALDSHRAAPLARRGGRPVEPQR